MTIHPGVVAGALGQVGAAFDYRLRFWFQRPRISAGGASAMAAYPPSGTAGTCLDASIQFLSAPSNYVAFSSSGLGDPCDGEVSGRPERIVRGKVCCLCDTCEVGSNEFA